VQKGKVCPSRCAQGGNFSW
jgi:hypothetical protein